MADPESKEKILKIKNGIPKAISDFWDAVFKYLLVFSSSALQFYTGSCTAR